MPAPTLPPELFVGMLNVLGATPPAEVNAWVPPFAFTVAVVGEIVRAADTVRGTVVFAFAAESPGLPGMNFASMV